MKKENTSHEFREILQEKLNITSHEFDDLFSTGKNKQSSKPQLTQEVMKKLDIFKAHRSPLLDIKI